MLSLSLSLSLCYDLIYRVIRVIRVIRIIRVSGERCKKEGYQAIRMSYQGGLERLLLLSAGYVCIYVCICMYMYDSHTCTLYSLSLSLALVYIVV